MVPLLQTFKIEVSTGTSIEGRRSLQQQTTTPWLQFDSVLSSL